MATTATDKKASPQRSDIALHYLRPGKKLPHVWCPGCGIGVVMGAYIRAVDKIGWDRDSVAMVSGIGCSSRMPVYMDFHSLHTAHGRALPFATGVKFNRPDMNVVVITGDGDALAIGGNHFIHACRRNINITTILINNSIYGMTGGQGSPTTPSGDKSTTTPYGNTEKHFDPCMLATAAGATFVARASVHSVPQLEKLIKAGLEHEGFSLIEVIANCHTYYGRLNRLGDAVAMLRRYKEQAVSVSKARKMTPEELEGKIVLGMIHEADKTEFCNEYQKVVDLLKEKRSTNG